MRTKRLCAYLGIACLLSITSAFAEVSAVVVCKGTMSVKNIMEPVLDAKGELIDENVYFDMVNEMTAKRSELCKTETNAKELVNKLSTSCEAACKQKLPKALGEMSCWKACGALKTEYGKFLQGAESQLAHASENSKNCINSLKAANDVLGRLQRGVPISEEHFKQIQSIEATAKNILKLTSSATEVR